MKKLIKLTILSLILFNIPVNGMYPPRSKSMTNINETFTPKSITKEEERKILEENQKEIDRLTRELETELLYNLIKKIVEKIKILSDAYPIRCANIMNLIKMEYNFSLKDTEIINDYLTKLLHELINRKLKSYNIILNRRKNPVHRPPSPLNKMEVIN